MIFFLGGVQPTPPHHTSFDTAPRSLLTEILSTPLLVPNVGAPYYYCY